MRKLLNFLLVKFSGVNLVCLPPRYDDVERQRQMERSGKLLDNVKSKLLMYDHNFESLRLGEDERSYPQPRIVQSRQQLEPPLSPISEAPHDQNMELLQVRHFKEIQLFLLIAKSKLTLNLN